MAYKPVLSVDEELHRLKYGVAEEIPKGGLREKLLKAREEKRPLRVKFGIDPSTSDLHLGHTVPLRKLKVFQEFGHQVVFLIGDFTAQIGDPTGKSVTRPQQTPKQVAAHAKTYLSQVWKVLDKKKTTVKKNSEWCGRMKFDDVIRLAAKYTVARLLERDDFSKRYKAGKPIGVNEFLFPLVQGYDSVVLKADVEMCSTDQIFNCLVARALQEDAGQPPEVIVAMPLIEGTDGVLKMSKSVPEHAIGITDPANDMYGKIMSIPDSLLEKYWSLLADSRLPAVASPRDAKHLLALAIVTEYHGEQTAALAQHRFSEVVIKGKVPDDAPEMRLSKDLIRDGRVWIVRLVTETGLAASKAEAQRLIGQGAVELNGEKVTDPKSDVPVATGAVLRVGKRRFARLKVSKD